jgi:hypothetical protein
MENTHTPLLMLQLFTTAPTRARATLLALEAASGRASRKSLETVTHTFATVPTRALNVIVGSWLWTRVRKSYS